MSFTSPTETAAPAAPLDRSRPPATAVGVQVLLLSIAVGELFAPGGLAIDIAVAVLAVFGSVLAFGVVRMLDDRRRTSAGYSDWTLVSARNIALWLMLITWVIGLVHIYRAATLATQVFNL
jgi:hypothetical protein